MVTTEDDTCFIEVLHPAVLNQLERLRVTIQYDHNNPGDSHKLYLHRGEILKVNDDNDLEKSTVAEDRDEVERCFNFPVIFFFYFAEPIYEFGFSEL